MKKSIRKIFILILVFVTVVFATGFKYKTFKDSEYSSYDFENTYADFNKRPGQLVNGDLLLVGDSFSFLCGSKCGYELSYIVHQGYDVEKINNEFMEEIPYDTYKYCYLIIGPNDFMEQTDVVYFQRMLKEIILKLRNRGMKVVMSNYLDPDYNNERASILRYAAIPCQMYDYIIKQMVMNEGLLYVDILDLFQKYGRNEDDFIHPHYDMYKPLMDRVVETIEKDIESSKSI